MKIPKTMDQESVLFWIGQRFLNHITQKGCLGLSLIYRGQHIHTDSLCPKYI